MDSTSIQEWIKRLKTREQRMNRIFAVLALLAGLVVLFLTFWFTYAIVYAGSWGVTALGDLIFHKNFYVTHGWRLVASGVFIVLLFWQHLRTNPLYWGDYAKGRYVSSPALVWNAGAGGAFAMMLAHPGASANMIADILLVGPRLVTGAWNLYRQSRAMGQLNETDCATLLQFLASRHTAIPYEELNEAGWEGRLDQLRAIDGVNFLERGISLSSELRSELGNQMFTRLP